MSAPLTTSTMTAPPRASATPPPCPLSPRELEVARLVGDDLSDKEIAMCFLPPISVRTVQAHLDHIVAKIGAKGSHLTRRRAVRNWIEGYEHALANINNAAQAA